MQTVVETASYLAAADRLFSPDERLAIIDSLASDPTCGLVIPGSGGIRKVRFGFGARGKSGGARISTCSAVRVCRVCCGGFRQKRES
jgi:hypothetical protein